LYSFCPNVGNYRTRIGHVLLFSVNQKAIRMADTSIKITLPIKSYLKKYLAFSLEVDPYTLSTTDHFGPWLLNLFTHTVYSWDPASSDVYNDCMDIVIPAFFSRSNRFTIEPKTVLRINDYLDKQLDEEMNRYLFRIRSLPQQQIKTHILQFRNDYEITEDELSYDALKKRHQRWMTKLRKGKVRISA